MIAIVNLPIGSTLRQVVIAPFPNQSNRLELVLLFIGKPQKFPRLQLTGMVGVQWLQLCRRGSLTETILEFSEGWNPDLVVMPTSSNLKSEGSVFASQTERVLRDCHCPLLALPVR